jgi:hypothetical protein
MQIAAAPKTSTLALTGINDGLKPVTKIKGRINATRI